jgi:hypothetical protein
VSTRGFITFVADGVEKTIRINNAYPGGLGVNTLGWLRDSVSVLDDVRRAVGYVRLLGEDARPTPEETEALEALNEIGADRLTPGHILLAGAWFDDRDFPLDSLWAEWGYVIDLDAQKFEVYRGFQQRPPTTGRFAGRGGPLHPKVGFYYPVALAASWPMSELPSDEEFVAKFGGGE